MPEMDGFKMSAKINERLVEERRRNPFRKHELRTKIYAVTAMNDIQIRDVYRKFGIEDVLTKPVKTSDLKNIIDEIFYSGK